MKRLIIASTQGSAGKTSLIAGMARVLGVSIGYLKPFGDRLVYENKRLWDYDAALMAELLHLDQDPAQLCIDFEHAKLRYIYDQDSTRQKLMESASACEQGKDLLLLEGERDLPAGVSVFLDAFQVARDLDATLVMVLSGNDDAVRDQAAFIHRYIDLSDITVGGFIINKILDIEGFKETHLPEIVKLGIPVLGVVPFREELTYLAVSYIANQLKAKVIAGERGLGGVVKTILVGAMSTDAVLRRHLLDREDKLVLTSGDRSDMILAALNSRARAIVLTNNILPPVNIISQAEERGIPLLQVPHDTFKAAKLVDDMEPLLTTDLPTKLDLLTSLVQEHLQLDSLT